MADASMYQKSKRFAVVIHPDEDRSVKLEYTNAIKHGISDGDIISICIGKNIRHNVRMELQNSAMWFGLGWGKIRTRYIIPEADILMFEKIGQKSYNLYQYNHDMELVKFAKKERNRFPIGFVKPITTERMLAKLVMILPRSLTMVLSDCLPSPMRLIVDDGTSWTIEWAIVNNHIWFEDSWQELSKMKDISVGDSLFFYYDGGETLNMKRTSLKEDDVFLSSKHPSLSSDYINNISGIERILWTSTLSSSRATGDQALNIPSEAAMEYFVDKPKFVNFKLPGGEVKTWSIIFNDHERNECHIGKGWYGYARKENLMKGIKLVFSRFGHDNLVHMSIENGL